MTTPEITLTEGQDTREDVLKIAHALWAEARARGWEREYIDILRSGNLEHTVPVVGVIEARLSMAGRPDQLGEIGELLKPLVVPNGALFAEFIYIATTEGEPGGECVCPETNAAYVALKHATDRYSGLTYSLRVANHGPDSAESSCSSENCRN